jgi:hypothetical protein
MSDYDPERIDEEDEVEEWEIEEAKRAIAPYLDEDGNIDFDKLDANCVDVEFPDEDLA